MLRHVATHMGPLTQDVVFLGGTVLPLLLSSNISDYVRFSKDVDFIIDFETKDEIYAFEDALWDCGFKKRGTGAVCRWALDDIKIDVLPADPDILNFNNTWCGEAMHNPQRIQLETDLVIKAISAPCYLAVKFDAFRLRGNRDYTRSFDIYDVLLIMAGHSTIKKEMCEEASDTLRDFLKIELKKVLDQSQRLIPLVSYFSQDKQLGKNLIPEAMSQIEKIVSIH